MTARHNRAKELRAAVERAMREEGATDFSMSMTGSTHQCLSFVVDGFKGQYTFAGSPGGVRWCLNACAAARRKVRAVREAGLQAREAADAGALRWKAEPGSVLSQLRAEAHRALDVYWHFGVVSRNQAYAWLADRLGMAPEMCHIGMFGEKDCKRVIELCRAEGPEGRPPIPGEPAEGSIRDADGV